ncbi:restriction endonuclease subunit S [Pseudomonas kielensis]|uniref:Restriction endonuclease subunit S n=1 Tax=Pseudomonas kielensis TaxID=2762577 RepID=A0A7X1KYM4_9PSED|nr:restriction endonuclease subunit S [Pseudomonas kielensis]MBC2691001.1 restriction endonuclease subunit S [Pseudomonas kielensis]
MVPEGWKEKPLIQLLEIVIDYRGISVPKAESGIPLITARNIKSGFLDFSEQEYIQANQYDEWTSRGLPKGGDILFTTEAPLGNACRFPSHGKYAIGQRTVCLRVNGKLDSEFLLQYLLSSNGQRLIDLKSSGSTAKGIKSSELKKIYVLHPASIYEQKKIAKILYTWDQIITTTELLLANSEQQKRALMQQLLTGSRHLPGFQKSWQNVRLEQIFSRVTNKNTEANTNVVTISARHGLIRQEEFFSKTVASETLDNYFLIKKGQFAYNKSYSNGYPMGAIKRLNKYEKGVVTTLYICFKVTDETSCNPEFFEHYFESGLLNNGLSKIANEGGRAHGLLNVKPSDFFGLTVFIPEINEQKAIAAVLTAADQEIQALQAQLSCLQDEKKALMQQLLTGKRCVQVGELEIA